MSQEQQQQLLRVLTLTVPAAILLFFLKDDNQPVSVSHGGKEASFLVYNKDEMFKNILGAEAHLRKVQKQSPSETEGYMNCVVKHLADAEGNMDEAVSHSIVTGADPDKFRHLSDRTRSLRHDVQYGKVNADEAIERVRGIRHEFEAFNPEFDVSKCKACSVEVPA